jgi:hypothetical protein
MNKAEVERERERERESESESERDRTERHLSGALLQTNWCNWPMKDLRSQVGSKTLGMPTEQGNHKRHLSSLHSIIIYLFPLLSLSTFLSLSIFLILDF